MQRLRKSKTLGDAKRGAVARRPRRSLEWKAVERDGAPNLFLMAALTSISVLFIFFATFVLR